MNKTVKIWFIIVAVILLTIVVATFIAACVRGCSQVPGEQQKMQIYINDNDSIVERLQLDVQRLTEHIDRMETDSFAVEIKRLKKSNAGINGK